MALRENSTKDMEGERLAVQGFGFQSLSQLKAPAPFFTMVQDQLLAQNTFSFWFSQVADEEPAGELYVGGVNSAKLAGSATFMTVPNNTYGLEITRNESQKFKRERESAGVPVAIDRG